MASPSNSAPEIISFRVCQWEYTLVCCDSFVDALIGDPGNNCTDYGLEGSVTFTREHGAYMSRNYVGGPWAAERPCEPLFEDETIPFGPRTGNMLSIRVWTRDQCYICVGEYPPQNELQIRVLLSHFVDSFVRECRIWEAAMRMVSEIPSAATLPDHVRGWYHRP